MICQKLVSCVISFFDNAFKKLCVVCSYPVLFKLHASLAECAIFCFFRRNLKFLFKNFFNANSRSWAVPRYMEKHSRNDFPSYFFILRKTSSCISCPEITSLSYMEVMICTKCLTRFVRQTALKNQSAKTSDRLSCIAID